MRVRQWMTVLGILAASAGRLPAQEIEVPLDQAGRIRVITAELAQRLGLFGEVSGFREARLFQLPDSTFVLELSSMVRGTLQRERRLLPAEQAAEFRSDVTRRITARAPTAVLDQGGRTKLLAGTTILGLGYYGWATAAALDPDDSQTTVAVYMLTAASSFIAPFLATRSRSVSDAVATMALWGATRGPAHGVLASELGDTQEDKTRFAWSVVFGAGEAVIHGVVAKSLAMTSGRAELTGTGGDIGLGVGFAASNLLGLDRRYRTVTVDNGFSPSPYTYQVSDRTLQSTAMLAAAGLGLVGGYRLGVTDEWTRGDVTVFRNVAAIGALAGLAMGDVVHRPRVVTVTDPSGPYTYSYVDDAFSRAHSAAGLLGLAGGVVLGRALVAGRNFSTGQGTLLTLSPIAGGLLGLGVAYLTTAERPDVYDPAAPYRDPNDHSELYLTASALGAAAGFAALYPAMSRQARGAAVASNVELSLNPLAAAQILAGRPGRVTLGSVRYRF